MFTARVFHSRGGAHPVPYQIFFGLASGIFDDEAPISVIIGFLSLSLFVVCEASEKPCRSQIDTRRTGWRRGRAETNGEARGTPSGYAYRV